VSTVLESLPLPDELADAARSMPPAYLRRRLMRATTPFIQGDTATFTYVGDAEGVRVVTFMSLFPELPAMERLTGTDLWHVTVELPRGSRVEYQLVVDLPDRTHYILDPLNRREAKDPFGANSVAHGPGYVDPAWCSPAVDASPGAIETVEIEATAFGDRRTMQFYRPAGYPQDEPYRMIVLHDGSDLIEYAALSTVLDNLIGAGAVEPVVAVLLDPVDRLVEYGASDRHAAHIVEDVLPLASAEFGVGTHREHRLIGGASMGAVAALSTAWRYPGAFDATVLLSGTFITATGGPWHRSTALQPVVDFVDAFTADPRDPAQRAWVACGAYEALSQDNRAFLPVLRRAVAEVVYEEPLDGHHWQHWRNNLGDALRALAPGAPRSGRAGRLSG
jgi:enterochelin esterase-like enzyme